MVNLLHYIDYYLSKTSQNFRYRNLFIQQLRYFLFIWLIYCIILIFIYLKPLKTLGFIDIVIYLYSNYGTFCLYVYLLHYIDYYLYKTSQNFRYRNLFIQQLRYFLFICLIYCIILIIIYIKPLKTLDIVIYLYSNYGTFCLYV